MDAVREDVFVKNSEIVVSFFTNRFYNEIYRVARDEFTRRGGRSHTDTYAQYLTTYLAELETSRDSRGVKMLDTVRSLCAYYCKFAGETELGAFIDCILGQIVPSEFYGSMGMGEKDGMFCDIIKQVATGMGQSALKPRMLRLIIDDRAHHQVGTNIMHDVGMDIIRNFKASLISKLYSKSEGVSSRRVVAAERYSQLAAQTKAILSQLRDQELAGAKLERDNKALAAENARLRARLAQIASAPAIVAQQPEVPATTRAIAAKPRAPPAEREKIAPIPKPVSKPEPKIPTIPQSDLFAKIEEHEDRKDREDHEDHEKHDEHEESKDDKGSDKSDKSDEEVETIDEGDFDESREDSASDDEHHVDIREIAASIAARNRARK